ncbi:hypothetical protein TNCV_3781271 [Trichonephila clavipes]|nr:hypothetical protein TNCV_3781271 [Trichonephila clavipes]
MPFRSQRNVPTALFVCLVSLFTRFYTPTLCLGSRFERDTNYPKSVTMGKVKFFKFPTNKYFSTGREKRFHTTPQRRLRQGSNEMLDRQNDMLDRSHDMLDRSHDMLDRSHDMLDRSNDMLDRSNEMNDTKIVLTRGV